MVYTFGNEVGVESSPIVEVMSVLPRAVSKNLGQGSTLARAKGERTDLNQDVYAMPRTPMNPQGIDCCFQSKK